MYVEEEQQEKSDGGRNESKALLMQDVCALVLNQILLDSPYCSDKSYTEGSNYSWQMCELS